MKILIVATPADRRGRIDELINAAHAAANGSESQIIILATSDAFDENLSQAQADQIYRLTTPLADSFHADELFEIIDQACTTLTPGLLLLTGDALGLQIAPRLAVRRQAAYVSGCSGFERETSGRLDFVRPVYGGKALEVLKSVASFTIITIKAKSFLVAERRPARAQMQTLDLAPAKRSGAITRVQVDALEAHVGPNLDDAAIIVSGGRGLGSAEGFVQLQRLADVLGGAVGASRAAVDAGWIASTFQVGQTGTIVGPDLYIAVGISGAVQHVAGIGAARHIVAINTDEEAPIFGVANIAVVADYRHLVPALIDELREKTT